MDNKNIFNSPTKGKMPLNLIVKNISNFIQKDPEKKYQLVVGTDSLGKPKTIFVTAIIIYKEGKGGRYFWKRINTHKIYHTIHDRIYEEINFSLKTAQDLLKEIKKNIDPADSPNYNFQIHIDVGQNGKTRNMIKEVVAIVNSNGFEAKIKPESYGASNVADKYV